MVGNKIKCFSVALTLFISAALFAACAPTPAPAPALAPAPAPAPTELPKFEWNWQSLDDPSVAETRADQWFLDEVARRTNGGIKITMYHSGGLGIQATETLRALSEGVVKIGPSWGPHVAGDIPILDAQDIAGIIPWDQQLRLEIDEALFPYYVDAFAEKNIVHLNNFSHETRIICSNKPMGSIAELKGQKIRAQGTNDVQMAEALGVTPVPMAFGEVYASLERGILDGHITSYGSTYGAKLYEHEKYFIDFKTSNTGYYWGVNKDTWDILPAEYQEVLRDVAREAKYVRWMCIWQDRDHFRNLMQQELQEMPLTDEMQVALNASLAPAIEAAKQRLGPIGVEIIDKIQAMVIAAGYSYD